MERTPLRQAIAAYLAEDIGGGDLTTEAIFQPDQTGEAVLVAKESLVCAGIRPVATEVFLVQNPGIKIVSVKEEGTRAAAGDVLLTIRGPVVDLFKAERVALNLARHLSGIATLTSRFVDKVKPLPVRIIDTRKTTPGLRTLEKYAVRVGGGFNHRYNLADGVLVKDNHIAACGSIQEAVQRLRPLIPHTLKIEVEAATIQQVRDCLSCGVDIIMLDNMGIPTMREAVILVRGRALLEASGGVTLDTVRQIAETGVDLISVGSLTHSAPAVDISMQFKQ
ncbi:MAG: carboxylating nicotinate-nucleotide diphosphorylase [Desulfobacterales bacterium]|nr:carboxylating nicotinate-nucleotide diphosphorylase [Desulfobacterales bacterium]